MPAPRSTTLTSAPNSTSSSAFESTAAHCRCPRYPSFSTSVSSNEAANWSNKPPTYASSRRAVLSVSSSKRAPLRQLRSSLPFAGVQPHGPLQGRDRPARSFKRSSRKKPYSRQPPRRRFLDKGPRRRAARPRRRRSPRGRELTGAALGSSRRPSPRSAAFVVNIAAAALSPNARRSKRPQLERYLAVRDLTKSFADQPLRFRMVAAP